MTGCILALNMNPKGEESSYLINIGFQQKNQYLFEVDPNRVLHKNIGSLEPLKRGSPQSTI